MRNGVTARAGQKDDFLKHLPGDLKDRLVEDRIQGAEARRKIEEESQEMFDSWNAEVLILPQKELEEPTREVNCRAMRTGKKQIGNQTLDAYDYGVPTQTAVVTSQRLNSQIK